MTRPHCAQRMEKSHPNADVGDSWKPLLASVTLWLQGWAAALLLAVDPRQLDSEAEHFLGSSSALTGCCPYCCVLDSASTRSLTQA